MLQLANFNLEYVKAWRADSAFWEGIPLNDCQWKKGIFIKALPCVNLLEHHRMAAMGRTGVGFDVIWERYCDHVTDNLVE